MLVCPFTPLEWLPLMPFVCVMMTVVGENDCVVLCCELVLCSRRKWEGWCSVVL